MALPVQDTPFTFFMPLVSLGDPNTFIVNPTIAAGDFLVSTNGAAFVPLATLPVVEPVGSTLVRIDLSSSEMGGAKVNVQGRDVSGDEWQDVMVFIDVPEGSVETVLDIQEGDHIESSGSLVINKRGTTTPVLEKDITGSLLSPSVTLRTTDPP